MGTMSQSPMASLRTGRAKTGALAVAVTLVGALFAAGAISAGPAPAGVPGQDNAWRTERRVANIAHAGGIFEAPQDTLFAFKTAADRGADVIEVDLHITADGHVVAIHDSTVNRTTDGQGCVVEHTLAELQQLDAAYTHVPGQDPEPGLDESAYPDRGVATGAQAPPAGFQAGDFTIPTLEEIFAAVPDALMVLELKSAEVESRDGQQYDCPAVLDAIPEDERPDVVAEVARLIDEYDMADQVMVASFIDALMQQFVTLAPDVDTSYTLIEGLALYNAFVAGEPPPNPLGHEAVQAPVHLEFGSIVIDASEELIDYAHQHGIAVHFWTINDEAEMEMLLEWGADGLITDRPQALDAILAARGDPRPGDPPAPAYVARFSERTCTTLHNVVAPLGFDSVKHLIRTGVEGFGGVADAGGAVPVVDAPANDGPCEIAVTWPAAAAARISMIATAWGVTEDQLHHMGGKIVLILLYLALSGGG